MNASQESVDNTTEFSTDSAKRKLFRNPDDKILGGVCSGLAAYFDWDVTLVRIAMIILGIFVHGTILAYIIAWIVIPPARTASEKLSMQGKKVNVENIGKTVTDGFDRLKTKMESVDTRTTLQRIGDAFVTCAGIFIKVILILLAICCAPVIFAMLIVFFVLIFVTTGLIAASPAVISDLNMYVPMFNWSSVGTSPFDTLALAISGILIIGIPIVGVIHILMRHFGGWQPMTTTTRVVFIVLWFVAVALGVYFAFKLPPLGTSFVTMF